MSCRFTRLRDSAEFCYEGFLADHLFKWGRHPACQNVRFPKTGRLEAYPTY